MNKLNDLLYICSFLFMIPNLQAQDEGFIYGRVTTTDNNQYTGTIRWGDEEVFWSDMFNASKRENKNTEYLTDRELEVLEERRRDNDFLGGLVRISWESSTDFLHQFSTQFGNIKSIDVRSSDKIRLELKNGERLSLDGTGYNDVGAEIQVMDFEVGTIQIPWRNIDRVEFLPTPSSLKKKFGKPLYGTVRSKNGEFSGFIQWDHDERLSTDELDGDHSDGDMSIPFGKIESIERNGSRSSMVTLYSGREMELRGSNDVNDNNRGIIVDVKGFGRVDIPWENFKRVSFEPTTSSGESYSSYSSPKPLKGTVTVDNGDQHRGRIIYDLDEEYDIEVLNGEDDDTKFIIPFKYIREIEPKKYDRAQVKVSNQTLLLEDSQDVDSNNTGILILNKEERVYVPWNRIERIRFE